MTGIPTAVAPSMRGSLRLLLPVVVLILIGAGILVASTRNAGPADSAPPVDLADIEPGERREFGPAPTSPAEPWPEETSAELTAMLDAAFNDASPTAQLESLVATEDPRLAWAFADLLRFSRPGDVSQSVVGATQLLLPEWEADLLNPWGSLTDHLIAWDVPAPAQYTDYKRDLYGRLEPRWAELFEGGDDIDWRLVSWGGVGIDARELGDDGPCRCIPALDDPAVTPADEGDWYPDDALVFGVVVDGEARAYPKNIMEVHEMVNDTLGGRRIGIPYCTLCGSAQAYFTDELPDDVVDDLGAPVFRTSGLLIRSNKMMYDLTSKSFIDTFRGNAVSGPLADAGIEFSQVSVVTSTWADWKQAHPDTTIIASDGGIGRTYELDPLQGRDDNGPIFPIGQVDPRLPVQEPVLGVLTGDGEPLAFHVDAAIEVLNGGEQLIVDGVELQLDAGGVRALRDGEDAGGHQAFWFAWSQFHPDTKVWPLDFETGA